ncbi:hypothetical protein [Bradyrhizobium sp. WSM1417]|uniref:hypothetical protein n=1 Tax=Bradyrhizobium sp. WSM1417 TaxID=754500 RepID=UPI0004883916|nr:hypothetical protein [Bradyrhizobium sp. WSM1417]
MNKPVTPDQFLLVTTASERDHTKRLSADTAIEQLALPPGSAEQLAGNDRDGEVCLVPNQETILARIDSQTGDLWFKQVNWPDDDAQIKVSQDLIPMFVDQLCDLLGIGSFGRAGK